MKGQWKGFLFGIILAAMVVGLAGVTLATVGTKTVNVEYNDVKVTLNGNPVNLVDAGGTAVEPFIIGGTTYLPVRAVANALGLNVEWDQATSTVQLTTPGNSTGSGVGDGTVDYKITYQDCRVYESKYSDRTQFSAIIEIKNTGTANLYLDSCRFDFEDEGGHLLETKSYISCDPEIIAPGEKGYFYEDGTLDHVTTDMKYNLVPDIQVEKAKNPIVRYEISDVSMAPSSYSGVDIIGRVTNNTSEDDGLAWVFFVLYREDGTPITAGGTTLLDLDAGRTLSFKRTFSESDLNGESVANYKVYCCKIQYQF